MNSQRHIDLSIRHLYVILVVGYLVLWIIGFGTFRVWVGYPAELNQIARQQQSNLESVYASLQVAADNLQKSALDYSIWDDTYQFVIDRSERYIESNFQPSTLTNLDLNGVYIVDEKKTLITGFELDPALGKVRPADQLPQALFRHLETLDSDHSNNQSELPIAVLNQNASLVATARITRSDGSGDPVGHMMLTRPIGGKELDTIASISRLDIAGIPWVPGKDTLNDPVVTPRHILVRCQSALAGGPGLCLTIRDDSTTMPALVPVTIWSQLILLGIIPAGIFALILRLIVLPLKNADSQLKKTAHSGQFQHIEINRTLRIKELLKLAQSHNSMVDTIARQHRQLKTLSRTDALTAALNRRGFDRVLEKAWKRVRRNPISMTLLLIDIDHFKRYNDHYGHPAGDLALQRVAATLSKFARREDEALGRWGGEEFAMLVYSPSDAALEEMLNNVHGKIAELRIEHQESKASHNLTVSIGAARIPDDAGNLPDCRIEDWVKQADIALYDAKASGRNCSKIKNFSCKP